MNIEEVRDFALSMPHATEDMPYGDDWVIFRIGGKIFLHIWLAAPVPSCAVKLPPEEGASLRAENIGIQPAYHLNKMHWSDSCLDELNDALVKTLIEKSYKLVRSKLPLKVRQTL